MTHFTLDLLWMCNKDQYYDPYQMLAPKLLMLVTSQPVALKL